MNRKVLTILALQTLMIVILFWVLVFYGKDEYEAYTQGQSDEIDTPNRVSTELGATLVTLSKAAQLQSGIKTSTLTSAQYQPTLSTYGGVISIDTLIEQRTRFLNAKADAAIARASLINSQQEYKRLLGLNQDDHNVADRVVAGALAAYQSDQAKVQAAETQANNVRDNIRQTWGETLATQATQQAAAPALAALLSYKEVLLQITLPFDTDKLQAADAISITPVGTGAEQSKQSIQAKFVSPSPQTDSTIQGETYFYRAPPRTYVQACA